MSTQVTTSEEEYDSADERRKTISERVQSYQGFIGYIRYVLDFWSLYRKCKNFRKYCEHNRVLENLPYSAWCFDLARYYVDHNTVRIVSAEFGGHARDCGCDRWEGLRRKLKRKRS